MNKRFRRLPSPALVISVIAVILAASGGSFARVMTGLSTDGSSDRTIANAQITTRAPGLSVNHAKSANSAAALTGVKVVAGPMITNSAGHQTFQSVTCPNGMHAISGGVTNDGGTEESVNELHLSSTGGGTDNAFEAHVNNTGPSDDHFNVFAVCINGPVTGTT
jgi:hypothetical protein